MVQARSDTWIVAGLCVAWAVVIVRTGLTVPVTKLDPAAEATWRGLSDGERATLVRQYQEIMRRPDGRRVLADARRFAELGSSEQAELEELRARARAVIRGSAAMERWLEPLSPAARAAALHRAMVERREVEGSRRGGGDGP